MQQTAPTERAARSRAAAALLLALCAWPSPCRSQLPQFVLATPPDLLATQLERVRSVDVDGDGDQDLVAYSGFGVFGSTVALLRNDGVGGFVVDPAAMPALAVGVNGVSCFDADGDGDVDLFLTTVNAPCRVLFNVGGGTFVSGPPIPVANAQTGSAVADFDGDGDLDVVVAGSALVASRDRLLLNDGNGQFPNDLYLGLPLSSTAIVGDLDLDGDPDLVFVDAGSGLRALRNDGALVFVDVSASQVVMLPSAPPATGVGFDLEGDGDLDLVLRGGHNSVDSYVENVAGVLTQIGALPGPASSLDLAVGDVDGDGDADVVRALLPSKIGLSLNDGAGGFVDAGVRMPSQVIYSWFVALSDLDGDGDQDVVTCLPGSSTLALRNRDVDLQATTRGSASRGRAGCARVRATHRRRSRCAWAHSHLNARMWYAASRTGSSFRGKVSK